ncbi:MAG: hypothetical protein MUF87_20070 [Anaerolineae bacterium]|jgi:homoserine kinase|nr:hypothetical protein [Anaerolineae bacterium]
MHKIKIRLPAAAVNLGAGMHSLGLALGLYCTVEISPRNDDRLLVETSGEGAGQYSLGLRHPVVLALIRMFQRLESAPTGLLIRVDNQIPLNSGLGAEINFLIAGVIGGNNLLGNVYKRDQMLAIAAQISRPDSAATAVLGGLGSGIFYQERLLYHSFPVAPLRVGIIVPQLTRYPRPPVLGRIGYAYAQHNLSRIPLLIEALRSGDFTLLRATLSDRLNVPRLTPQIPGLLHTLNHLREQDAAVTLAGDGPALLVFGEPQRLESLTAAGIAAFKDAGVSARTWIVPIDTQGVIISVMG